MATVTVGCKLLHGVKLHLSDGTDVMLRGARQAPGFDMRTGEGAPGSVGLTEIDASVWAQIQKEYARWPMLTGAWSLLMPKNQGHRSGQGKGRTEDGAGADF